MSKKKIFYMTLYGNFPKLWRFVLKFTRTSNFFNINTKPLRHWNNYRHTFFRKTKVLPRCSADSKLLFAIAAGFTFKEHGVSVEKLQTGLEISSEFDPENERRHNWEVLVEEPDFRALRRKLNETGDLYEYRCAGTYYDISPRNFLDAQIDLAYRKEWDANIISLELLSEDNDQELLRWISKFPYPMNAREYVYVRRTWVSDDGRSVVVESVVVPEEIVPSKPDTSNVRVATYNSRMAIRAHGEWNEHGLDYVLTYSDNPEANIPRYVYNWIVNQGGPYFLKQVHNAALQLELSDRELDSVLEKFRRRLQPVEVEQPDSPASSTQQDEQEGNKANQAEPSNCRRKESELIPGISKNNMPMGTSLRV